MSEIGKLPPKYNLLYYTSIIHCATTSISSHNGIQIIGPLLAIISSSCESPEDVKSNQEVVSSIRESDKELLQQQQ